jgi:hypothetical protein
VYTKVLHCKPHSKPKEYNSHLHTPRPISNIHFNIILSHSSSSPNWSLSLGSGLWAGYSRVAVPAGTGNFSLHHRVQNGSGARPASYPMGTRGSFPGGKATGVRGMKLTTHLHLVPRSSMRGVIPLLPNTPSWRGAQHRVNFFLRAD